jgi:hypothetical protein
MESYAMKIENIRGLMLAAAAAALFTSGATFAAEPTGATEAKVHCGGVNSCKGQNSCKGVGFKAMTEAECTAKGGKVVE